MAEKFLPAEACPTKKKEAVRSRRAPRAVQDAPIRHRVPAKGERAAARQVGKKWRPNPGVENRLDESGNGQAAAARQAGPKWRQNRCDATRHPQIEGRMQEAGFTTSGVGQ